MATIVISDPDASLSVESTHFFLRARGRKIGRIPLGIMEQVVIHHGVEVTRKAMSRLGACGIPVTFLDAEGRVECRPGARLEIRRRSTPWPGPRVVL